MNSSIPPPPSVWLSEKASPKTARLWELHGPAHSKRYANPSLTSFGALLRHNAVQYGDQAAFLYPDSSIDNPTYKKISWRQFDEYTSAVATTYAESLEPILSASRESGQQPTVALMGIGLTLEYFATEMALQKLNLRVLLLADNLPRPAYDHLITATDARALIFDRKHANSAWHATAIPMLEDFPFAIGAGAQLDAYRGLAFEDGQDPWERHSFVIHSSGSTGLPKPIFHTNRSLMLIARMYRLFPEFHIENWLLLFPLFHIAGISIMLSGLPNGCTTSLPPRAWPPRASAVLKACETLSGINHPVECIHTAPVMIESLVDHIDRTTNDYSPLSNLRVLQPGGAMLSSNILSKLTARGVNVKTTYGSTEIGPPFRSIPHSRENPECYRLANLYPENDKIKMEDIGGGLYECVVYNGFELAAELWKGPEDTTPYRTRDLFIQNPPNSGYYYLEGRTDDVLVHSTGENTNATPIEVDIKSRCGAIKSLVLMGHGQPCTSLLVELKAPVPDAEQTVIGAVSDVNHLYPRHSTVLPSMIYFLLSNESLPVTPKGNVKRKEAEKQFRLVLDRLYNSTTEEDQPARQKIPAHLMVEAVRSAVSVVTSKAVAYIDDDRSLFDMGIDSVLAIRLASKLSKIAGKVSLSVVFEYPTVNLLSTYLNAGKPELNTVSDRVAVVNDIAERFCERIRSMTPAVAPPSALQGSQAVLLTGSSGSLGTALIDELTRSRCVFKVYALVQGENPAKRLLTSMSSRGYDIDRIRDSGKLEILPYDMTQPLLGLGQEKYSVLASSVSTVLHGAWMMDFNKLLGDYEACLNSVLHLLQFCTHGSSKAFAFVSSIAACMGENAPKVVPEIAADAATCTALNTGYAQSKYIVERMCQTAYSHLNLPISILRLGQMYGHSNTGVWSSQEMFPIMIATSLQLGALPTFPSSQVVDWVPVDVAAATMHDVIVAPQVQGANSISSQDKVPTYNIVNPKAISWSAYIEELQSALKAHFSVETQLNLIPIDKWTELLLQVGLSGLTEIKPGQEDTATADKRRDRLGANHSVIPGVKLAKFFEEMASSISQSPTLPSSSSSNASPALSAAQNQESPRIFQTANTEKVSAALRQCDPVNEALLGKCIDAWKRSGFI